MHVPVLFAAPYVPPAWYSSPKIPCGSLLFSGDPLPPHDFCPGPDAALFLCSPLSATHSESAGGPRGLWCVRSLVCADPRTHWNPTQDHDIPLLRTDWRARAVTK